MKYTLSFDASVKLNRQNMKGLLNHNFRDVLEANGRRLNHSNEAIDASRTSQNESVYYNQQTHNFEKCTDISQIESSIYSRLAYVKKPLRKDAVIARAIVLQLEGDWFKQNYRDKHPNLDMLQWAIKVFGEENIVGASIHKDEANPHLHILFTPVTEDGRLSQKDWFKDPKSLRDMHNDFREYMSEKGYDIERQKQPRRKHLSEKDYKTFRQADDKIKEFNKRENELKNFNAMMIKQAESQQADMDKKREALLIQMQEAEEYFVSAKRMQEQAQGELVVAQQYADSVRNIYERFKHTIEGQNVKNYVDELEKLDETLLPSKSRSKQKEIQYG